MIAERIDAFSAAWDQALEQSNSGQPLDPPKLDGFVAGLSDGDARHSLIELVKLDVERRWQHGVTPRKIEDYAADLPQLGAVDRLPADLLYEELQARMLAGRPVFQEEVLERFPRQAESLLRLLGGMALSGSPTATYFADTVRDPKQPAAKLSRTESFAHLKPGDAIDDFQLIAPLGSGAFARVFLARQVSMERMVALKISTQAGSEPQTLAQLDHPNIVRVYDQRACADPPTRLLYMEVVPGGTLQDAIAKFRNSYDGRPDGVLLLSSIDDRLGASGSPRPENSASRDWIEDASWPEVVARLGAEMAEGLAYAHSRGVLHRDLKPANVLLSAEGKPKIADFNVSYNGGRADENPEDAFGGSLAYMSPEQLEACHPLLGGSPRLVRAPSDLYALGVMLWELLAGRRPFRDEGAPGDGGSLVKLQRMIESRRQTDLAKLAADLPKDCPESLRKVLVKCLAPKVADRYQTAHELSQALRLCLHPRCWSLLEEPKSWLGRTILRRPVLALVAAGLLPNAATAAFNFQYNKYRIELYKDAVLMDRFNVVQAWVNTLAFSLGLGIGIWAAVRAFRLLRSKPGMQSASTSTDVLLFGRFITYLVVALWTVSGVVFPVAIGWGHPIPEAAEFYAHFFLSLALCGFASTAYPYFLDTAMAARYFVPQLIRRGVVTGPKRRDLQQVLRLNRVYLALATAVPLLGMLLLVLTDELEKLRWAIAIVSGGGLLAFGAMALLDRLIRLDVEALDHIAVDEPRSGGTRGSSRGSRSGR
jgi:serine/threonine protein kinase